MLVLNVKIPTSSVGCAFLFFRTHVYEISKAKTLKTKIYNYTSLFTIIQVQ